MSWQKIPMKFPGTCIVCHKKIQVKEIGLWAKGMGVKHVKCAEVKELLCILCGGPAGCPQCEFQDSCDIDAVSPLCVCKSCSGKQDPFATYRDLTRKKFNLDAA